MENTTSQAQGVDIPTPSPVSLLSCDIGIKHMALCHYDGNKYRVFFFTFESPSVQSQMEALAQHLGNILDMVKGVQRVIIELQLPNTRNIQYMYSIMMFFTMKHIPFTLQRACDKYSCLSCDPKNFKTQGAINVMQNEFSAGKIELAYNKAPKRAVKNHRWMDRALYEWLDKNGIDKFDDIADTVLMIKRHIGVC